jgi:hypothetical protein
MAKKRWTVEIGFNRFDGCKKKHKAFEICDGCRDHQGVMQMKVSAESASEAVYAAMDEFYVTRHAAAGYEVVTLTMDGDSTERLPPLPSPPRAAAQKQRSPPAPKGSTASKRGSAQKRGGKGQRKA